MSGENSWPEAEAGIVADFYIGEAEVDGLAEEGCAVGGAIGVPAGGEGEGGQGHAGMSFGKRGVGAMGFFWEGPVELGDGVGMRRWQNRGQDVTAFTDQKSGGG